MSGKIRRGGLGRGLGALIPTAAPVAGETGTAPSAAGTALADGAPAPASAVPGVVPEAVPTAVETSTVESAAAEQTVASDDGAGTEVAGAAYTELRIDRIRANAKQPRRVFDEDALAELTHSVREVGVLQPIVVRPEGDGYELVMGERRLRAAVAAGLETIPAIVRSTSDDEMLRDALLENIHRAQLNPLEEAAAYQQLLEDFGVTHDQLAQRIGRSRPLVSNTIRLLNLPVPVQRRVAAGVLSAGHARALLGLDDPDGQEDLAARIVAEGLSVRATEEHVALLAAGHRPRKSEHRTPVQRISAPAIDELAAKLCDVFDTRVRVELGRRKGKITVEFATVDDLERIVTLMAPTVRTGPGREPGTAAGPEPTL